jgi:transcriptional regulator with XRE-family HTH domain
MKMTIGDRLKQVRVNAGLLQKDIAKMFGLKMPGYNRIENNKIKLTLDHLLTLKEKFGISIDWLITGETVVSEIDRFGEFRENIKKMLSDMEKDPVFLHGILSHYHEMKQTQNKERGQKKELNHEIKNR